MVNWKRISVQAQDSIIVNFYNIKRILHFHFRNHSLEPQVEIA